MSRLNYRHLYYFWRVATEGNLTRVAEKLHISQSALSSQIRSLESATGVNLFDRTGRGLTLTEPGRRALEYATDIFSRGEELEAWLQQGGEGERRQLRIGLIATLSRNFIDRLLQPLFDEPGAQLSLETGSLDDLLRGLSQHQLDVALTNGDVRGSDELLWESRLLARQPISIIGRPEQRPEGAFPAAYRDYRWILPTRDSEVRRAFESFCSENNYTPDIYAEANDMPMLRLLARDSGALTVLPAVVVQDEISRGILAPYMTVPDAYESFYAITVRRAFPAPMLNQLFSSFRDAHWQDLEGLED